ncbi:MAG: DUF2752 domain-containing protein [Lachnospiraceae bacterium]|nr:DUF2752 domain-containing protein [Lachnospiraceae bacterium]
MREFKEYVKVVYSRIKQDVFNYRWAIFIFAIYYVIVKKLFRAFCPLVIMTGFPCPACGMTRAFLFLMTGQFERSWNAHPMAIFWVILAIYCIVMRYLLGKKIKGVQLLIIILLLAMIICYVYRMITLFPNQPPMSYTRNNMLRRLIQMWQGNFMF